MQFIVCSTFITHPFCHSFCPLHRQLKKKRQARAWLPVMVTLFIPHKKRRIKHSIHIPARGRNFTFGPGATRWKAWPQPGCQTRPRCHAGKLGLIANTAAWPATARTDERRPHHTTKTQKKKREAGATDTIGVWMWGGEVRVNKVALYHWL